jgi:predicted metal-dependent enzyme (double-stranded beta helix superfamily)
VTACRDALQETTPSIAVRSVLERTLEHPTVVADALGRETGGIEILHHAPDLTIINFVWAPQMQLYAHDHRMWAAIGIYGGTENNAFYRRTPDGIASSGGKEVHDGDVLLLGAEAIHSVRNPTRRFTGAIHVYGGDFINQPRSQWNPETLTEEPFDLAQVERVFADANDAWIAETRD